MVRIKRVYDSHSDDDGKRVLVDRVWPRGIPRDRLHLHEWMKDVAPSTELRKWFAHRSERWSEFVRRYEAELNAPDKAESLNRLAQWAKTGTVTLLFSARDEKHNQAVVLADVLTRKFTLERPGRR